MDPRRGGGAGDAARTASEDRKRWLPVGAAPASGLVTPPPRGPRSRSGGTMTAPRGARWTGTAPRTAASIRNQVRRGAVARTMSRQWRGNQETRTREQKSPRWSAERRPRSRKESAARRKTGAPLGAPSPRHFRRGENRNTAYPGPQTIRAMARAHPTLRLSCANIRREAPPSCKLIRASMMRLNE